MNSKSFSGTDLERALAEGTLTQAQTPLTGMVKPSEKSGHVSFTQAGCDTWVDLPTDMIERADQVGQRPCRDHSHPIMRITLKEPKDPKGKILLALLTQAAPEAQHVDELRTYPTLTPGTGVSSMFARVPPGISDSASACNTVCLWFCPGDRYGNPDLGCVLNCIFRCSVFKSAWGVSK